MVDSSAIKQEKYPGVSLAVVGSAAFVALGLPRADPIIGLGITLVILRITWQSWATVRGHHTSG